MLRRRDARRSLSDLLMIGAIGGLLLGSGGSGIPPEPDAEGGGDDQSPTHEQDALREDEERGEEGGRR